MQGTQIGNYHIIDMLGEGGMGQVWRARNTSLGNIVAIKMMAPEFCNNQELVERFFNEARGAANVKHPGIVDVYEVGFHQDRAYMVMEFLNGDTLKKRLQDCQTLDIPDAMEITRQIAGALDKVHERGIFHRDLKPENIILVRDDDTRLGDRAKILDFGIAKHADEMGRSQTRTGIIMGTPPYMSPEQIIDTKRVDGRTDLYALGCILFEMLCGRPPFIGPVNYVMSQHLNDAPPPPRQLNGTMPRELSDIIMHTLAKDPAARFSSARDLIRALDGIPLERRRAMTNPPVQSRHGAHTTTLSGAAGHVEETVLVRPMERKPRRWAGWLVATGTVLALGVGGVTAMKLQRADSQAVLAAEPTQVEVQMLAPASPEPEAEEDTVITILVETLPDDAKIDVLDSEGFLQVTYPAGKEFTLPVGVPGRALRVHRPGHEDAEIIPIAEQDISVIGSDRITLQESKSPKNRNKRNRTIGGKYSSQPATGKIEQPTEDPKKQGTPPVAEKPKKSQAAPATEESPANWKNAEKQEEEELEDPTTLPGDDL